MNKLFCLILLSILTVSCIDTCNSDAKKVVVNPATDPTIDFEAETLKINIAESKIDWIATEMRGTKRRTGKISFSEGFFLKADREIAGGSFTVDMETIDITDVPIHEKIARKNLLDHLKSDDFFNVAVFPYSTLKITNVEKADNGLIKISANLTIREITKNIEFLAQQHEKRFSTRFTFNRLDWNIAYEGSWADRTLIDKDVELKIDIGLLK